jgi:hypothetical protein
MNEITNRQILVQRFTEHLLEYHDLSRRLLAAMHNNDIDEAGFEQLCVEHSSLSRTLKHLRLQMAYVPHREVGEPESGRISFRILPAHNLAYVSFEGHCSLAYILDRLRSLYQHPEFEAGMDSVWDLYRAESLGLDLQNLTPLSELRSRYVPETRKRRTVMIARPGSSVDDVLRLGIDLLPLTVEPFLARSLEEGLQMLGLPAPLSRELAARP